jgi:hypothetical protein
MTVKEISEVSTLSGGALALVQEDSTPSTYLDSLEKQQLFQDAIKFLAHKLAVDVGVKWACACVRELQDPELKQQKDEPLEAAEQWIKAPGDPSRRAAKDAADKAKTMGASYLVAMAVFLSGDSITPPDAPETKPPPYSAQKLIAGSVASAAVSYMPEKADEHYKRALAMGRAFDQPGKG